jgi:hypothetical protein
MGCSRALERNRRPTLQSPIVIRAVTDPQLPYFLIWSKYFKSGGG